MRVIEVVPKPSSLTESMRDIGYSLSTALADIVDNSITARAQMVQIFASSEAPGMKIGVLDDGVGMTERELLEAMRLGSRSPLERRQKSELGRFGLGLKTASFSQCRMLTVVTRSNGMTSCARWDLDHIAESDKWQVQIPDDVANVPWMDRLGECGTLIVWEKLAVEVDDRGAGDKVTDFVRQVDEASSHLELAFHRFLTGGPGQNRVRIVLNNRPLEPFDPFHASHPATIVGPTEHIRVAQGVVVVQPFTLPHHGKVTSADWSRYAGPEGYLKNQGFYLYRERRLIIHGTWFGLARQTELSKLARVRVDMPNSLDRAWRIDIKKASAQLPSVVRERLRRIIEPLVATSKRVYTTRGRRLVEQNRIPVWSRVQDKNEILYRINDQHPIIASLQSRLPGETHADFRKVMEIAGASLPLDALLADLGGDTDTRMDSSTSEEALHYAAVTTFDHVVNSVGSKKEALAMMQVAEPFRSNWDRTVGIIESEFGDYTSDA